MVGLAVLFGLLGVTIGLLGLASPATLTRIGRLAASQTALNIAGIVRVFFGVVLVAVASASRAPAALAVIGVVLILAGLATPLIGPVNARRWVDWWAAQSGTLLRVWACLALAIGGLVLAALLS